jgi:hypothetical protein
MTVEPGRQLAGRYRVEDLLAERAGARLWRAVDEVLRRSVAVDVLPSDSRRASALTEAARRAAVVTDGRFLRVLDAAEENGDVYVVREWARGETLDMVLADGPLTHRRAAWVVHEVAEAVSVAHSAGIYHLRLVPENVLVTDTGSVKIIGLATDAALHGVKHADAEAEDVRGLGHLLYAALVARWPGGPGCALPEAPSEHGRVLRPAQVRAGVPRDLDEVCDRILGEPPQHKAEPLRHASAIAAELDAPARLATDGVPANRDPEATQAAGLAALTGYEQTGPVQVPEQPTPPPRPYGETGAGGAGGAPSREPAPERTAAFSRLDGGPESTRRIPAAAASIPDRQPSAATTTQTPPLTAPHQSTPPGRPGQAGQPSQASHVGPEPGRRRGWAWAGVVAVVAVLAAVSFYLGFNSNSGQQSSSAGAQPTATADPLRQVPVASVSAFDPFGEAGENDDDVPLVLDGDTSTRWSTLSYEGDPRFGGLKPGLGLVLDLGGTTSVRQVTLDLGGSGTDLQLRAAPAAASSAPDAPGRYRTVGSTRNASGETVVEADRPVDTRYLLVWLTSLSPEPGGTYAGVVNEITVQG